jgi:ribonuclease P protein component
MRGEQWLRKPVEYAAVYRGGRVRANSLLVMNTLSNGLSWSRYGFSISRRVGSAVVRNRLKRRLREILSKTPLEVGWDIVFVVRPKAANVKYAGLQGAVSNLLSGANLLRRVE